MAIRNVVQEGDEVLRQKCALVENFDAELHNLLDDMRDTLKDAQGAGLAAPQVGVLRRIVVIETPEEGLFELINPKIIAFAGEQRSEEGCLSIPGRWGSTRRPRHVTVQVMNRKGETFEISGSDLLARAFCHELDHLDGKLFIDCVIEEVE